jgi:Sulfatase
MEISLSPALRAKLRDFLICFSLGNLCFLRRWYDLEHLKERSIDYYRVRPADPTLLIATLIAAFLLSGVFWLAWTWVQRNPTPWKMQLARCGFLLLLIFPLESVRRYWNSEGNHADWGTNGAVLTIETLLAIGLVMTLLGNQRVVRAARRVALLLTLLFPSLMVDFAWSRVSEEPVSSYQPKPSLPMLSEHGKTAGPRKRVIWMLFDEFDQRLAFELRQPKVDFTELDRLRSESLVADHASQTAPWTALALPSLLSGRTYLRAELINAATLEVYPNDGSAGVSWRDQPNVFREARKLGANAEIIGWHHPYCRVFGDDTVRCLDVPNGHPTAALLRETGAADEGIPKSVKLLFALQLSNLSDMLGWNGESASESERAVYVQHRQLQQYFQIRDRAYCEATDKDIDLLFIHFPLPHLFAIYDRERRDFTLSDKLSYVDNLALVDRTVGEMRRALERSGLWDSTSLLITSDHGLRPELWRGRMGWTEELERLTAGGQSQTVPFIVKLAGQDHGLLYDRGFSSVLSSALVLAMLSGEVATPHDAAAWLDVHLGTN